MHEPTADRMLRCATSYYRDRPECSALPTTFATVDEACEHMSRAMLFEAHHAMQKQTDPPHAAMMQAVDLQTPLPGIVASKRANGYEIQRLADEGAMLPPVTYGRNARAPPSRPPDRGEEPKRAKMTKKQTERGEASAERRLACSLAKAEAKAAREIERETAPRAPRKPRAAQSDALASSSECTGPPPCAATSKKHEDSDDDECNGDGEEDRDETEGGDDGRETRGSDAPPRPKAAPSRPRAPKPPPEYEAVVLSSDTIKVPAKGKKSNVAYFSSPVPHDRHLLALGGCDFHENIRNTVLRGVPSANPALKLIEGPPGTGKTTRLVAELRAYVEAHPMARCVVCAPTNVGACNLFRAAFASGLTGALSVAKEHVPPDTPRSAQTPKCARIVFCTLSGRSSPRLWRHEFDAVFVDEAALCCEALVWGVMRASVSHLVLVGDTLQLSALVSEEGRALGHARSMMERLRSIGVEFEQLLVQRRMHPEIARFPSAHFYGGRLRTDYSTPASPVAPYAVRDVRGEEKAVGTSWMNEREVEASLSEAFALREHFENVVILVPYVAQMRALLARASGVLIATIDSMQGKEADAVVLSVVRTQRPGFWADPSRLNVATTRARHAMCIVTNCAAPWTPEEALGALVSDGRARGVVGEPS